MAYSMVKGVEVVAIDGTGTVEEVTDVFKICCEQYGYPIPLTLLEVCAHIGTCDVDSESELSDRLREFGNDSVESSPDSKVNHSSKSSRVSMMDRKGSKRESMGVYGAMANIQWE